MVKACFLPEGESLVMQTTFDPADSTFTVFSRSQDAGQRWTVHARGVLRSKASRSGEVAPAPVSIDEIRARCPVEMVGEECYAHFATKGLDYGPSFQGVTRLWQGNREALGRIHVPETLRETYGEYLVHPATLDACLQVIFGTMSGAGESGGVYLPVGIEQVRVHASLSGAVWCHARLVEKDRQGLLANLMVYDEAGRLLVEARGLRCQSVGGKSGDGADSLDDLLYEYRWQFQPRAGQARPVGAGGLPAPSLIAADVQAEAGRLALEQRVRERYDSLDPRRNALCSSLIWQAFTQLGVDVRPGMKLDADALMERHAIVPRHRRLLGRLLAILGEDGILQHTSEGAWEVVRAPDDLAPAETWKDLVAEHPAFIADLILLGRCGQNLAGVLCGEVNPVQLIFSEGGLGMAEHFYQDSPCQRFYHSVAQAAITVPQPASTAALNGRR